MLKELEISLKLRSPAELRSPARHFDGHV